MICGSTLSDEAVAEHDGQLLAQVGEQLEDAEAGKDAQDQPEHHEHEDRDRGVEQRDQRTRAASASRRRTCRREGDGAQHAQRRELDDEAPSS